MNRRFPVGGELTAGGAHFRLWAPNHRRVEVVLEGPNQRSTTLLESEPGGYFSGFAAGTIAGDRYRFLLDGSGPFPDPASRFQPDGPHGPSELVDSSEFQWGDQKWAGVRVEGQVIYEMHIGTFTKEGTWNAARPELPELASAGITLIEMMPVAEFPGTFGWGYDGVDFFAPYHFYGRPEDLRSFINDAHGLGIGVILDVVYNHAGPDGNYLSQYAPYYFTSKYDNEWGDAINFDGENAGPVREFFRTNAAYWIGEYHMDGLRLDATQQIFDHSPRHIIAELTCAARAAAPERDILILAENESQDSRIIRPVEKGGYGADGLWNDDFHHSARVAVTARNEAYYTDYHGSPQELTSAAKYGYLFQGQRYSWQKKRRGTPTRGLERAHFVNYLQNHDQVANSADGARLSTLTDSGRLRAITALLLLGPQTPMLFQGQEFGASTPFQFFADHSESFRESIFEGRRKFLSQFRSLATPEMLANLPDPSSRAVFEQCKLDLSDRERNRPVYELHKDLIRLRRGDSVFRMQGSGGVDGAVLGPEALALRYFEARGDDRLVIVNLGRDLHLEITPEPLLAPPEGAEWQTLWSSEDPKYGGTGIYPLESEENWRIPGHAAVVLRPTASQERSCG